MQGEIGCVSELGKGSTFFFTIRCALADQSGPAPSEQHLAGSIAVNRHKIDRLPEPSRKLRVLLAEDSPINQRLATTLLQKFGHQVVVANNGLEAVASAESGHFDLVLMDVQMPEMDGFEASRQIREREDREGGHVPIIAVTAHAMAGDRDRCLRAGMDAYISKPMRAQELFDVIEESVARHPVPQLADKKTEVSQPEACVNWKLAMEAAQNDRGLLQELVEIFLDEGPKYLRQAQQSLERGDLMVLQRAARTIKGSARLFGASALHASCEEIETLARDGQLREMNIVLNRLHSSLSDVLDELRTHLPS
jgi:CheY-like chemotaxis protein